jgi:hypothetical protein
MLNDLAVVEVNLLEQQAAALRVVGSVVISIASFRSGGCVAQALLRLHKLLSNSSINTQNEAVRKPFLQLMSRYYS